MRWVFVFFLILLIALSIGVFIFITRLDLNKYRPYVESKLSEALQANTKLGNLSLAWEKGIGIGAEEVRLQEKTEERPFVEIESLSLRFDPLNIFRQRLVFYDLTVEKPNIFLNRHKDKTQNWPVKVQAKKGGGTNAIAFFFSAINIKSGTIHYLDESLRPTLDVALSNLDLILEQKIHGGLITYQGSGDFMVNPPIEVKWHGEIRPIAKEISFDIRTDKEEIVLKGETSQLNEKPQTQVIIETKNLNLDLLFRVLRAIQKGRGAPVGGLLNANAEFRMEGKDTVHLKSSLNGKGKISIRNGVFRNINVVRLILKKIEFIPGLQNLLIQVTPSRLKGVLTGEDTPFETLEANFSIVNEKINISSLLVKGDHYAIEGSGWVTLAGEVNFQGKLTLMDELSQFVIGEINELSHLTNQQGLITIPFVYQGSLKKARPQPDIKDIGQRLIVEEGTRLLEKGLEALDQLRKS